MIKTKVIQIKNFDISVNVKLIQHGKFILETCIFIDSEIKIKIHKSKSYKELNFIKLLLLCIILLCNNNVILLLL